MNVVKTPEQRYQELVSATIAHPALPRNPTGAEKEIARLKAMGLPLVADLVEAAHPTSGPEVIQGDVLTIDAERVWIGRDGLRLLALTSDEIRQWLARHANGEGGAHPQFGKVDHDLVRSKFNAWRPSVDHGYEPLDPAVGNPLHPGSRRRNRDDWVEISTLVVGGKATATVIRSSRDQHTIALPGVKVG